MPVIGKKIIVLGCPGSGKSTFSKRLHFAAGLPLIHLDNLWWNADRTHITREDFDRKLDSIFREDTWILDGDYSRTYEVRFEACDTVILLDFGYEECIKGITERISKERTDIPWVEQDIDPELVNRVQCYAEENRPVIYSLMEKYPEKYKYVFHSREETNQWLDAVR